MAAANCSLCRNPAHGDRMGEGPGLYEGSAAVRQCRRSLQRSSEGQDAQSRNGRGVKASAWRTGAQGKQAGQPDRDGVRLQRRSCGLRPSAAAAAAAACGSACHRMLTAPAPEHCLQEELNTSTFSHSECG